MVLLDLTYYKRTLSQEVTAEVVVVEVVVWGSLPRQVVMVEVV